MRPAEFSTENPPHHIDDLETREYVNSLRRRIEVQNDLMASLSQQVQKLLSENEALALDLAIKQDKVGPGWQEVDK